MPAAASARPSAANALNSAIVNRGWIDLLAEHLAERDRTAERLIRVHRPHLRAHGVEEQVGIAGGAHRERALERRDDRIRQDDDRQRIGAQPGIPRVGDDADDGDLGRPARIGQRRAPADARGRRAAAARQSGSRRPARASARLR